MKKLFLSGFLISSLVLAGCKKTAPTAEQTPATPGSANTEAQSSDNAQEWADALKAGESLRCTIENTNENTSSQLAVKGKKVSMTNTTTGDTPTTTKMISDAEYVYTWDDAKKEGMKMKLPTEAELKASAEKAQEASKNIPQAPDFSDPDKIQQLEDDGTIMNCTPGTISDSEFIPPTDVQFQDFSAMMNNALLNAQEGMTAEQKKQMEDAIKQYAQ